MIINNKNKILIYVYIYFFVLSIIYSINILEIYSYAGYPDDFSILLFIVSILILFIALIFVSKHKYDIRYNISLFLIVFGLIPNLVIFFNSGNNFDIVLLMLLFCLSPYLVNFKKRLRLPVFNIKQYSKILTVLALVLVIPFVIQYGFKFNLNVFLLGEEVYDVRGMYGSTASLYMKYLYSPITLVVVPLSLLISIKYHQKMNICILLCLQLYMFLVQPQKHVLFSIPLIIFFYLFSYKNKMKFFLLALLFIFSLGIIELFVRDFSFINSLFARRTLLVPANLNWQYFDFFRDKEFLMNSHSWLSFLLDYPYSLSPPNLISAYYTNDPVGNANNGIISTGYMNFGYIGVLVNILIYAVIVRLLYLKEIPNYLFGILALQTRTLLSSAMSTSLLTHGLGLLVLLVLLLPSGLERK